MLYEAWWQLSLSWGFEDHFNNVLQAESLGFRLPYPGRNETLAAPIGPVIPLQVEILIHPWMDFALRQSSLRRKVFSSATR